MNDYAVPYQRRSKNDLKRKRKMRVYKRGGTFRGIQFKKDDSQTNQSQNQNKGK